MKGVVGVGRVWDLGLRVSEVRFSGVRMLWGLFLKLGFAVSAWGSGTDSRATHALASKLQWQTTGEPHLLKTNELQSKLIVFPLITPILLPCI